MALNTWLKSLQKRWRIHSVICLYPVKNNDIDIEGLFKIACGKNGIDPIQFWELTPREIMLIDEGKQGHYELVKHAFYIGYVSAKKGKSYPLFKKQKMKRISDVEHRQKRSEFEKYAAL